MGKMEQGLIRSDEDGEHHYVWMTQRFNEERMWVWVVNLDRKSGSWVFKIWTVKYGS